MIHVAYSYCSGCGRNPDFQEALYHQSLEIISLLIRVIVLLQKRAGLKTLTSRLQTFLINH